MYFEKMASIWQYMGVVILIITIIGLVRIHKLKEEEESYLVLKMIGFYLLGAFGFYINITEFIYL